MKKQIIRILMAFSVLLGAFVGAGQGATTQNKLYYQGEEVLIGTPAFDKLMGGYLEVITDPFFWENYLYNSLVGGVFALPLPIDFIKPELVFPASTIKAGPVPSPLPLHPVDLSKITYNWKGLKKTVKQFLPTTQTDVIAFVYQGQLVYEDTSYEWTTQMHHQLWSATKSFASALVGIAWGDGLIDSVDDPIEKYIGDLKGTAWEGVTIKNLLQMESGILWNTVTHMPLEWSYLIWDMMSQGTAGMDRNEFLRQQIRVNKPGTVYNYCDANTQVLGWLVETLYGKSFAELLSEKIWIPLGMESDAEIMTDRLGNALPSMGLFTMDRDMARFGEMYRNNGKNRYGKQIIPTRWIEDSMMFTKNSGGIYGYQWWKGAGDGGFAASGLAGQLIDVTPAWQLTGIRLAHEFSFTITAAGDGTILDPKSYGLGSPQEWGEVYRAVADYLKTTTASSDNNGNTEAKSENNSTNNTKEDSTNSDSKKGCFIDSADTHEIPNLPTMFLALLMALISIGIRIKANIHR